MKIKTFSTVYTLLLLCSITLQHEHDLYRSTIWRHPWPSVCNTTLGSSRAKCCRLMKQKLNSLTTITKCKAGKKKKRFRGGGNHLWNPLTLQWIYYALELCGSQRHIRYRPFSAHILPCHSMKSAGVTNNINDCSVPSRFQYIVPASQHAELRNLRPETPIYRLQPWLMLLVTPLCVCVTSLKVCFEEGLLFSKREGLHFF